MIIEIAAIPNFIAKVRALPGNRYLCTEVADALGISTATLRRLGQLNQADLGPNHTAVHGRVIALYDQAAVDRLHDHLVQHPPGYGRPRLWSDRERHLRRAAHSSAGYRRRRAAQLAARGDEDGAAQSDGDAHSLATALRAEHAARVRLTRRCDVTAPGE